jgi:hypothetical protein
MPEMFEGSQMEDDTSQLRQDHADLVSRTDALRAKLGEANARAERKLALVVRARELGIPASATWDDAAIQREIEAASLRDLRRLFGVDR